MPRTQPHSSIVVAKQRREDYVNSCYVCHAASYDHDVTARARARRDHGYRPNGLALYELRISPTTYCTDVTRLCADCLREVQRTIAATLNEEG